ncbi:MAG: Methylated-DNA--protein-cysteine methyltransferase [Methanoregula sp. PtaU1.Bin051]|nr:MAG: Methylated-DNA--protein-cysteine methyltransferase [Methanoregula sp. PtaU1.Bin051]
MEIRGGSCRLGLWHVRVWWDGMTVHRVQFATTGLDGPVPELIRKYCGGQNVDLSVLNSIALDYGGIYSQIYRTVQRIPYGRTATYGEIARRVGTAPRVVGQAMAHNPTPIVIPCHRVIGSRTIGGFTPSVEIKETLLALEQKTVNKNTHRRQR